MKDLTHVWVYFDSKFQILCSYFQIMCKDVLLRQIVNIMTSPLFRACFSSVKNNPLNVRPTKWSNRLKQLIGNLATNSLSVFDHFVILALKWLKSYTCTKTALAG